MLKTPSCLPYVPILYIVMTIMRVQPFAIALEITKYFPEYVSHADLILRQKI
jgi:hypothetical protein